MATWKSNQRSDNGLLATALAGLAVLAAICLPPAAPAAGAEADHGSLDCGRCHRWGGRSEAASGPAVPVAAVCAGCHRTDTSGPGPAEFHRDRGRECIECHSFHDPSLILAGPTSFAVDYADRDALSHCASCHNDSGDEQLISAGHRAAASFYHVDSRRLSGLGLSDGCLECHGSGRASAGEGGAPAFSAHASHPYGVRLVAGRGKPGNHIRSGIDSRLPLFSGRVECQSCHQVAGRAESLLIAFPRPYDMCLGCHEQPFRPGGEAAAVAMAD